MSDTLLLSLKKLTFCLQEWEHDPETMPKSYDQQPRHVQRLMDLIREYEEEKPYG